MLIVILSLAVLLLLACWFVLRFHTAPDIRRHATAEKTRRQYGQSKFTTPKFQSDQCVGALPNALLPCHEHGSKFTPATLSGIADYAPATFRLPQNLLIPASISAENVRVADVPVCFSGPMPIITQPYGKLLDEMLHRGVL